MTYSHSVEIEAPIGRVFDLLENPEKQTLWMGGLEQTVFTSQPADNSRVGARFVQRMRGGRSGAEFEGEITVHEKPHRLAFRVGNTAFSADFDYRLERKERVTVLSCTVAVVNRTPLTRLSGVLMGPATRRMAKSQLKRLKAVAEARG